MRRPRVCMIGLMAVAALGVAGCGSSESGASKGAAATKSSSQQYGGSSTTSQASTSESGAAYSYAQSKSESATGSTGGSSSVAVVKTKSNKVYGEILAAGPEGHTVYMFAKDKGGKSSCSGACASVWPPVITTGSPKAEGKVVASKLGTTTRSNGEKQVTYAGHPLYYYVADKSASDVVGQGVVTFGAAWYVLSSSGEVIKKA